MEPSEINDLIQEMCASFLDGDADCSVEFVQGVRVVSYIVVPRDRTCAARIIGFKGERIKSVESFIALIGRAWGYTLTVRCESIDG